MTKILKTIAFNTCRKYAGPGQVVIATLYDDRAVTFFDHSRHIDGEFILPQGSVFGMGTVMRAYDGDGMARTYESSKRSWQDGMRSGGANSMTAGDNWRSDFWVMMQEDSHGPGYQPNRGADGQGRVHVIFEAAPDYLPRAKLVGLSLEQLTAQLAQFTAFHCLRTASADELLADAIYAGFGPERDVMTSWLGAFLDVWQVEEEAVAQAFRVEHNEVTGEDTVTREHQPAIEPHIDDHAISNSDRADRAARAVDAVYEDGDLNVDVGDLLCDTMHLCDRAGINFADTLASATNNHLAETDATADQRALSIQSRFDRLVAEALGAGWGLQNMLVTARNSALAALGYVEHVDHEEAQIIEKLLTDAIAAGYLISVFDGEETPVKRSRDLKAIRAEIAATDETQLAFHTPDGLKFGWVQLIHGNGTDVISDYNVRAEMDALVAGASALAESMGG